MEIININQIEEKQEFILDEIKKGKIFIYPTDTVYGLGCDATNYDAIEKIFKIKQRESKALLIIAPSKTWIYENFDFNSKFKSEIETKLPGPYAFIFKFKKDNKPLLSKNLAKGKDTIGIRIPDCKFNTLIEKLNRPFITTSVNITGQPTALKLEDIPKEILEKVDYLIETKDELLGKSSQIFDLTGNEIKQLR